VAIDPDSEVICAAEVGPANRGDAAMAEALLADLPAAADAAAPSAAQPPPATTTQQVPVVYGDGAYGTGALLADLAQRGVTAMTKVAAPHRAAGALPQGPVPRRPAGGHGHLPSPAQGPDPPDPRRWRGGPLRPCLPGLPAARLLHQQPSRPHHHHPPARGAPPGGQTPAASRPAWRADYRAHRPTVERKLAHLLRRRHGGRRARMRGRLRVTQDWRLLAAAINLARFAALGIGYRPGGWTVAAA
jgi:hypothetical protein